MQVQVLRSRPVGLVPVSSHQRMTSGSVVSAGNWPIAFVIRPCSMPSANTAATHPPRVLDWLAPELLPLLSVLMCVQQLRVQSLLAWGVSELQPPLKWFNPPQAVFS